MATVQVTAFFCLLSLFVGARSQQTVTVDQSDLNAVTFTDGWTTVPHSPAIGGSFAFTSKPEARVNIALPQGAVAARYVGQQPETSTTYSYCVDCFTPGANDNLHNATSVQVDGDSSKANEGAPPLSLFTLDNLDPTVSHVMTVFNPKPQNVITFDAVIAELLNNTETPSTLPPAPPTPVVTSTSTPSPISSVAPPDPSPTPPPASDPTASIGYSSATSTLPPPLTTSRASTSSDIKKRILVPLIVALLVAFAIILVAILLVHLHIRRSRRDDPIFGSDGKSPSDPDPHDLSTAVVQDHSDSTESGVLPTPVIWSATSLKSSTWPPSAGAPAHSSSMRPPTPSMMETLQSQNDSSESVPNKNIGNDPRIPEEEA